MENYKLEEDVIVISLKRKKNVVKDYIALTKSETVEQKVTVFTVPPFNSGRTNGYKKDRQKRSLPNVDP